MPVGRTVAWNALTCRLEDADIYLGLAAGADDVVAQVLSARQMVAFPFKTISIATGSSEEMPLRVYAIRDTKVVEVADAAPVDARSGTVEGFRRVSLSFRLAAADPPCEAPRADEVKPGAGRTPPCAVFAFLLTIGLPPDAEDDFFATVVHRFLERSWMTLPKLLRELGCNDPLDVAEGHCGRCSS